MCDSYLRLAPYRLNAVKHCILRKSAAVLISFRFKTVKFMRGNVFPIKCNRMLCFLKERCGAYFVRPVLRAAFFPVYTVWIAFVGFITLGSICITFECINYYIWGHYICWLYYRLQNYGKADRGHKLSLPSCRSIPGGLLVLQNGWMGRGACEPLRCSYYFLWKYTRSYSSFYPLTTVFHVVAFRVVTSKLSQERKNMTAMFTKLACLHALFLLCICPFVLCTLPSFPDSIVTGTLNR